MQYHHLFFHSLIVYPELAFKRDNDSKRDFETWMITVDEYKAILKSLYEKNYCLVKMSELVSDNQELNSYLKSHGKIPLVFSYDDVNYYQYMTGYGFAQKMVIDTDGCLANIVVTPTGNTIISKEADGPAILEEFIREHPDFSYQNARGILAVTGYEGILGYHELEKEKDEVVSIIKALKEKGWEFACHSYSHNQAIFKATSLDEQLCIDDTECWFKELDSYLPNTNIYIAPFGIPVQNYSDFYAYLKKRGFRYFCNVNNIRKYEKDKSCYIFPRVNIDGFMFKNRNYEFEYYYGKLQEIISHKRLKEYPLYSDNAESLAIHALVCSKLPTVYLWGGIGEYITDELIQNKQLEYPNVYTADKCAELRNLIGEGVRGFDCSGLIKNYLMGGLTNFKYNPNLDYNSSMFLEVATQKGTIATLPEQRGICLYMPGHVGIYLGNNWVIESTSNLRYGNGVVKTKLSEREWTHWFACPGIKYGDIEGK